MNDPHLHGAAKNLLEHSPDLAKHFSEDALVERLRAVVQALKLETIVSQQID